MASAVSSKPLPGEFFLICSTNYSSVVLDFPPKSEERGRASLESPVSLQIRKTDKATILDLEGPLKMGETEHGFRDSVRELLESGTRNLAINLSGVPMMDSSGVGALVRAFSSVNRAGGRCKVFGVRKQVMQILKMVCLDRVLDLEEDEDAALRSFEAR